MAEVCKSSRSVAAAAATAEGAAAKRVQCSKQVWNKTGDNNVKTLTKLVVVLVQDILVEILYNISLHNRVIMRPPWGRNLKSYNHMAEITTLD